MPILQWIGKEKVVNHHLEVPCHVLSRTYSFDEEGQKEKDNGSENMVIHGDNLLALKSLLPQYEGRVKCIYIDPPYNTGNEGWVYNDAVNDPVIKRWLGEVVGKEGEDLSRHDKWLCMMYPRLRLLQRLLSDDGVIFISIDDREQVRLRMICDEIFGENRIAIEILRGTTLNGFLKISQDGIVTKLGTSRSTVVKVFKKAKEAGVLMAVGKRWYVNPYVALPYNLGDADCNKLQQMWDSMHRVLSTKGTVSMKEALLIHEVLFGPDKTGLVYNEITGEV